MAILKLLEFLEEDEGYGDITAQSVVPEDARAEAEIVLNENGVLAGLEECRELAEYCKLSFASSFKDGDRARKGDIVAKIKGEARKILTLERLLLNMLMRMSGIATSTSALAKRCEKYGVAVAGTRKTTPGFRYFEKKAVALGGGDTHRFRLDDAVLIKDNHLVFEGIEEAVRKAKKSSFTKKVEVEVSSLEEAAKACEAGADIVMLDNFGINEAKRAIQELRRRGLREKVLIEISGGITTENVEHYAKLRPDVISMGYLTTSSRWLDMSMHVKKIK